MKTFYLLALLVVLSLGLAKTSHGIQARSTNSSKNITISRKVGNHGSLGGSTVMSHSTNNQHNLRRDSVLVENDIKPLPKRSSKLLKARKLNIANKLRHVALRRTQSVRRAQAKATTAKATTAKPATSPKSAQAKPKTDSGAKPTATDAAAKTPEKKPKAPITTANACTSPWLKLYTDDISKLKPQKMTELGTKMCNSGGQASGSTCCTDDMYRKLSEYWTSDIVHKADDHHVSFEVDHTINYIFNHKYNRVGKEATKLLNSGTKFDAPTKISLARLSNAVFSENDVTDIKIHSRKCWRGLARTVMGSYCAICDAKDSLERFRAPDNIQISYRDVRNIAILCSDYQNVFLRFISYTKDLARIIKIKDPSFKFEHASEMMGGINVRLLVKQTRKCIKDPRRCESEILLNQFGFNLVTKLETNSMPALKEVAKGMIMNFHNPDFTELSEDKIFNAGSGAPKSRLRRLVASRELQAAVKAPAKPKATTAAAPAKPTATTAAAPAKPTTPDKPKIVFPISMATKGLSPFWKEYSKYKDFHYTLRPMRHFTPLRKFPGEMTTLHRMSYVGYELIRISKTCPMAEIFGGKIKVGINGRSADPIVRARGLCLSITKSCCTETTFVNYRDQWNAAQI